MRSGEWLSRTFQTSGSELVQATSDVAALVELSELEDQARRAGTRLTSPSRPGVRTTAIFDTSRPGAPNTS